MDVHLRSTTVCALDAETGKAMTRRFRGNPWGEVAEWMSGFPAVARRLRERLPRLRPGEGALRARRRLRRRGRLQGPEVSSRPLVQEQPRRHGQDGQGDTVARRHPGMGAVPRDRGAQGPRRRPRRRDREARGGEAAAPGVPRRRGYVYGGTTPGNPRRYWTYGFLRWLDGIHPDDDGGIRALAALRNEVEAADETRALLAEYRAAVAAGLWPRSRRSSRSRGAGSRSPPPSRPRSATSRGSAPAGR